MSNWNEGITDAYTRGVDAGKHDFENRISYRDEVLTASETFVASFKQGYEHGWYQKESENERNV